MTRSLTSSTATAEEEIDLEATNRTLVEIEREIRDSTRKHHAFLEALGLRLLP
jgi:type I restriction enzyme M protein